MCRTEALFGGAELEAFRELLFGLLYTPHGGSGLSLTRAEVLELDLDEVEWLSERLDSQRQRESAALKRAGK